MKKGIDFLILGTHYNRDEPGLLNEVGWFTGQKFGRADEQKQFRRLFRDDKDFHEMYPRQRRRGRSTALGPDGKPDNWLVARLWYNKAIDAVTFSGKPIRGKTPLLFYIGGPMSQINGAAAIQTDGYFFEPAQAAWEKAAADWLAYGNRELPTAAGFNIRLNDQEPINARVKAAYDELEKLAPGVREQVQQAKLAALAADKRAAYDKPTSSSAAGREHPGRTGRIRNPAHRPRSRRPGPGEVRPQFAIWSSKSRTTSW